MIRSLLRSLQYMRKYRVTATLAVLAVLASSAADLATPQVLRVIVDAGIRAGDASIIFKGVLVLIGVAVFGAFAEFLQDYLSAIVSHGAAYEMRNAIFGKLQELSFAYHDRAEAGNLITRVTSDVDQVRDFVGGGLVSAVSAVLLLVGAVVLLLVMDWRLALVALAVVPATMLVLTRFVGGLWPMFRRTQEILGRLNSVLQENIAGIRVVKAFAREEFESRRYERVNAELLEQGLEVRRMVANAFPLMSLVGSLGAVAVTWYGAVLIVHSQLTVGGLVAFTTYVMLLLTPVITLGFGAQSIARSGASAARLFEVLDAPNDVAEKVSAVEMPPLSGRVVFDDVAFRYPGDKSDTLCGLAFEVTPGETIAIVGATGSGKTTVVNLIPRFYEVSGGRVLLDGIDVRDVTLDSLRRQVGVVMQDSVLFSGTVAENIAYGRTDASAEEIRAAAIAAQVDPFVRDLPADYDTVVGERGVMLSGGQRQRVAIARALLIDPRILIMDDSTSSVDATTENALRAALDKLVGTRTTFVVAQRLSTVRRADRILLLDGGRLVAVGSHEELLASSCLYAEIAASQLAGGEELPPSGTCEGGELA